MIIALLVIAVGVWVTAIGVLIIATRPNIPYKVN